MLELGGSWVTPRCIRVPGESLEKRVTLHSHANVPSSWIPHVQALTKQCSQNWWRKTMTKTLHWEHSWTKQESLLAAV